MILVNGLQSEHIRVIDRGLSYGDGVFRTILIRAGKPLCWRRHYDKLQADCKALTILCPPKDVLTAEINLLIKEMPDCVIKIIVTRGESQRGYAIQGDIQPTRIVMTCTVPQYPENNFTEGVRLHLCATRLAIQPLLAGIKHLNRLENILARNEWTDPDIAEGLMLDTDGHIIEGTMSNVFLLKGKILHTPDLARSGVAGIQRDRIIEIAATLGLTVRIENLPLARIYHADEVVICNSVIGVWQVRALAKKIWPSGKLAERLRGALDAEAD